MEVVHEILDVILNEDGAPHGDIKGMWRGKTLEQMTDKEKINTLAHMIRFALEHTQSPHYTSGLDEPRF